MPSTPRWGGLRPEPYDPDARDADGDGIVQEGTAFERPFGTRILDGLGRDIIRGSNLLSRDGLQYRDRNNQPVMVNGVPYAPQAVSLQSEETALGRIGHSTIGAQLGTISNPNSFRERESAWMALADTPMPRGMEDGGKPPLMSAPPVSEIVPPAPRRGPDWLYHTKIVKVKDKVTLKDRKTKKRFGPLLDEIANIHGVGDDANPVFIELRKSKGKRAGGTFYRRGEDGFSMPSLWASGEEDTDLFNVLHEMGHWLDSPSGTYVSSMSVNHFGGDYSLPEMNTFLERATIGSPHYMESVESLTQTQDQAYVDYFNGVHEVWARAYSQYMARELERSGSPLGVQIGQALNGLQSRNPEYTWPDDEFDEHIAPLVEDVLRARGLLNGSAREESGIRQGISGVSPPLPEGPNAALTQLPSSTEPRTLTPLPRRSRVPDPLTQSAYRHDPAKQVGEGDGSEANPFKVASSSEALALINDGHHVEMDETTLAVVLNDLQAYAREAKAAEQSGSSFEQKDYDLCRAHVPDTNFFCEQHRGIVRLKMPQVAGKNMLPGSKAAAKLEEQKAAGLKDALGGEVNLGEDFLEFLTSRGVSFGDVTKQDAVTMKATQRQLVGAKVGGMMNGMEEGYDPGKVPIIMSSDGFIFDGHHRWAAVVGADHLDGEDPPLQMNVRVIDLPIEQLLALSQEFLDDWGMLGNAANADNAAEETEQKAIALPKTASKSQKKLVDGFISVEQRVLDEHGPITNPKEAEAALNKAFPASTITLDLGETMTARDHGAITGLLAAAITDPDAAKSIGTITISSKPGGKSSAVIDTVTAEGGLPRYGMNFVLNTSGTYETGVGFGLDQGVVGDISSLHEQGHPTEILDRFDSTYQALHEYGHAVALQRQLADAGLDLSAEQDIEWWGQFGDTIGHDFRGELDKRKYRKDPDKAAERINELLQDPIVLTKLTDTIDVHSADGLSPEDALSVKKMVNQRSALSAHSNQEMAAEIFALEHLGVDPSDAGLYRRLKEPDYVAPDGTVTVWPGESEAAAADRIFKFNKEHKEGRRSYADIKAWLLGDRDGDGVAKEGSIREKVIGRASQTGPRGGSGDLTAESQRRYMEMWVNNPGLIRTEAELYLGRALDAPIAPVEENETVGRATPGGVSLIHNLLTHLHDDGVELPDVYRGLAPGKAGYETDNLTPGGFVDIPLVGVTRDRSVAGSLFHGDRHGGTILIIENSMGVSVNERLPDHEYSYEDEWLIGGRFEVVSVTEEAATTQFLKRRPTSMYGEDAGGDRFEDWAAPVTADTPKTVIRLRAVARFDPNKVEGSTKVAKLKLQTLSRGELVPHPFAKALSDAITPSKPRGRLTPTKDGGLNVHIATFPHKSRVASPPKPDTSDRPATKSFIETKGLRPQLIVEPYDPDAQDGDGDGIVQEGTAFERPVGSRLIDEAGKDIVRGFTSTSEMKLRTVDKDGNPVENKRIARQPAGQAKEKVKGVLDAFSLAKRKSTLKSQGHRSIGTGLPKLEALGHKSVIDRVAPKPPKPAKVKKKLPSIRKKRSAHAPTAVLETYERDKARVAELHGDVSTADKAHAALAKAFPRLEAEFLFNGEAEWKAKPDAPLSADERGWVTSLLVLADDHPEAAKALRVLSTDSMTHHDMPEATNAFVTVQPMFSDDLEKDMHIFGALLAFNPDGTILPNSKKKRFSRKDKRYTGTANEEHIQELLSSGQITIEQARELTSAYTATHEFGHVIHFTQTLKDMGIDITDPTKNDENIVKFLEIGLGKKIDLPDPDIDTLDWRTAVDELLTNADDTFYAEWDKALTAASFDALNDDQIDEFLVTASEVSQYAETGIDEGLGYEAFAELFAAEKWGIAHQPDESVGKMREWTDVVVGEDNGAGRAMVFTRPEQEASDDLQAAIGRVNESATGPARLSSGGHQISEAEADAIEARMRAASEASAIYRAERDAERARRDLIEAAERQKPEDLDFPTNSENVTVPTPYDLTQGMVVWSSWDPSGPRDAMADVYEGLETYDAAYARIRAEFPNDTGKFMGDTDWEFKYEWEQYVTNRRSAAALLNAISDSKPIDEELTRGEISDIPGYADTFVPGQAFTMDVRGFTTDPINSTKFSTVDESKGGDVANKSAVLFVVKPGDSTALPLRYFDDNREFADEKEHLLAGTYEVVAAEQQTRIDSFGKSQTVTVITIVQTATIPKPPTGADGIIGWKSLNR